MKQLNISDISNIDRISQQIKTMRDESYRQGWKDAISALKAASPLVKQANGDAQKEMVHKAKPSENNSALTPGTLFSSTYEYVKNNPGSTGVEVINGLRQAGVNFSGDGQVVRTCLFRLRRDRGLIDNKDGKWYAN